MTYYRALIGTTALALLTALVLIVLTDTTARAEQTSSARYRVTAASVVTGQSHTCALLNSGAVRCWGYGGDGRLGYGNTNDIGGNATPALAGNVPLAAEPSPSPPVDSTPMRHDKESQTDRLAQGWALLGLKGSG